MKEDLLKKIPEIHRITDEDIREKTIAAFLDAMQIGGWKVSDLDRIPFSLLIADNPISFLTHTRAVTAVALESAKILNETYEKQFQIDMDILLSGAILHDIGKLLEYKETSKGFQKSDYGRVMRHPFSGAGLALKHGLPGEVQHIIATHAHEGDGGYRTPASAVVHHADFMNFDPLRGLIK
ncbi:HD domain-containing protein [bacterium]|nr:HD domain-containing protein [bacterium]